MTKEEILNGMSEEEFYQMYPTKESWEAAYKMKLGGLSGAPHNGQPTADEFFSYGSHANDKLNIPMGNPFYLANGGRSYATDIYSEKKMNPAQWQKFNESRGYKATPGSITSSSKYKEYYNPKEYQVDPSGTFTKVGAPQGYDYTKDPSYKPIISYGYKEKVEKKPIQPWTPAGTTSSGQGLFYKDQNPALGQFTFTGGKYTPYTPQVSEPMASLSNNTDNLTVNKLGGSTYYGGPIYPAAYGGGLPGGPHEMPCMECGGYMEDGGFYTGGNYNSPTNYGSFSVPMTYGGDLDMAKDGRIVDWAKQQQQKLAERTGQGIPSGVSKYYGAFDVPNLSKMDSVVTSPINPNIGMAFKGSKSMLVPLDKSAEQDVRKINKPFTVATPPSRGEREVFVSYQEFGGAYDPSVAGTYPMLDMGGLKKIIYAAAKKTKKAYGGDTVIPGGNQDYKEQYRNTFDNFIKQNTYNAIVDNEREAMMNELAQMDQPSYNMPMGGYDMDFAQKGKQTGYNQANTQRSKVMEGLANMFAPTYRTGLFSNIVPANIYRGYEFSNKDYDYLKSLGDDAKISGLSMEYGPLARGLGKFGRRMFGPKSITFGTVNPNKGYFEDLKEPYQLPTETQDNKTNRVSNKAVKEQLKQDALRNKIIDERKNAIGLKAYGGLFKAYDGVQNPIKFTAPISDDRDIMPPTIEETKPADYNPFTDQAAIQKRRKEQEEMFGAPMDAKPDIFAPGKSVTAKRETDWSSLASYAPGAINTLAASFEESSPMGLIGRGSARYRKNEADKRQAAMYTPGSNQGPFVSTPSSARDMGNYTINQGMFRPDDAAYAQSPGNIYGYAQMGGYVEGEELDLSPEQIAELIAQGYEIEELD